MHRQNQIDDDDDDDDKSCVVVTFSRSLHGLNFVVCARDAPFLAFGD